MDKSAGMNLIHAQEHFQSDVILLPHYTLPADVDGIQRPTA